MSTVIKVENLSKQYRLGNVGSGSLKDDLTRWWYRMRGKEDPLLQIGDTNDRTAKGDSDYVWALKDINFEVQQGDVLGIIGRNGAGKSTLLKILSKTTAPTTGSVKVKGRIASLLEVGTGFHPELTGRENIYLNGAILGMRKHEITRKLDEIIDFAGVERYIDTPVKRYSSGMYVRLAFGVAAHLESEILIIDEVLAVGDAEFQKKCLGKMGDVAKGEGRTVLFVSHNMVAVQKLCSNVIMLKNGIVLIHGETSDIIANYLNEGKSSSYEFDGTKLKYNQNQVRLNKAWIDKASNATKINIRDSFEIVIELTMLEPLNINLTLMVYGQNDDHILSTASIDEKGNNYSTEKSTYQIKCKVPGNFFNCGNYKIALLVVENYSNILLNVENIFTLEFEEGIQERGGYVGPWNGIVRPKWDWKLNKII